MKEGKNEVRPMAGAGSEDGYLLVRSRKRKRTISLELKRDGKVVIHAPWRTSLREIEDFFRKRALWLAEKRREMDDRRGENLPHRFLAGEQFLFLGEPYPLELTDKPEGGSPLSLSSGCFLLRQAGALRARTLFMLWYRAQAREYLAWRVQRWNESLFLPIRGMRISDAKCRWGSCSHANRLSFSWRLIMASPPVIDYVVVHELTHIREKNHSRRFWGLLAETLPGYEREKAWLREKGHLLDF